MSPTTNLVPPDPPAHGLPEMAQALGRWLLGRYRQTVDDPLGATVRSAHEEIDARRRRALSTEPIACRAGCAYRCYQQVSVTAAEILVIADSIEARPALQRDRLVAELAAADRRTHGMNPLQRWAERVRCPFLGGDNRCGIYADRPFGCRGYASLDLAACRQAFDDPAKVSPATIPQPRSVRPNAILGSLGLQHALAQAGLANAYDLNHGLTIALDVGADAARARYIAGEDGLAAARIRLSPTKPVARGRART